MFDLPRNQGIANALKISEFLCPNLGWIQGQIIFTELSLRYRIASFAHYPLSRNDCYEVLIRQ